MTSKALTCDRRHRHDRGAGCPEHLRHRQEIRHLGGCSSGALLLTICVPSSWLTGTFTLSTLPTDFAKSALSMCRKTGRPRIPCRLPVQLVQETSEIAELTGPNVRYHLISQWPINKANAATTEFERRGLKEVQAQSQ